MPLVLDMRCTLAHLFLVLVMKVDIWEIDDVLADRSHRLKYRHDIKTRNKYFKLCAQDTPKSQAIDFLKNTPEDRQIILLTNRPDVCKDETEKWLYENGIKYDRLIMRDKNDYSSELDFKTRVYRELNSHGYEIMTTIDVSPCIVEMWRHLGIETVLLR